MSVLAAELAGGVVGDWLPVPDVRNTEGWRRMFERRWGHVQRAPMLDREGAQAFQWPEDGHGFKVFLVKEDPPPAKADLADPEGQGSDLGRAKI